MPRHKGYARPASAVFLLRVAMEDSERCKSPDVQVLVLANGQTKTLPIAVLGYIGYTSIQRGTLMAASCIITMPVVVLALCVQNASFVVRSQAR